jgi:hypothetical protein
LISLDACLFMPQLPFVFLNVVCFQMRVIFKNRVAIIENACSGVPVAA